MFDGTTNSPYVETDPTYPINMYGISKLSGEHMVRSYCQKHFIVRSSGLYGLKGSSGKGGNFVESIINLSKHEKPLNVVEDQILTPTNTADLSKAIVDLINSKDFGTYHITNKGECSWFEFASYILHILDKQTQISPCTSSQFNSKARRPVYSVLSNQKSEQTGIKPLRNWKDALREYISLRA